MTAEGVEWCCMRGAMHDCLLLLFVHVGGGHLVVFFGV